MHTRTVFLCMVLVAAAAPAAASQHGSTAGLNWQDAQPADQVDAFSSGTVRQSSILSVLSFVNTEQTVYQPGSSAAADLSVDIGAESDGATAIFEVNRCDESVPRSELTRSDCNSNVFSTEVSTATFAVSPGQTWAFDNLQFTAPGAEGNYELVAYMIDTSQDPAVVSEAPNEFISVAEGGRRGDADGDGVENANDPRPFTLDETQDGGDVVVPNDRDGDGVSDAQDACQGTPGSKRNGCPTLFEGFIQIFVPGFTFG